MEKRRHESSGTISVFCRKTAILAQTDAVKNRYRFSSGSLIAISTVAPGADGLIFGIDSCHSAVAPTAGPSGRKFCCLKAAVPWATAILLDLAANRQTATARSRDGGCVQARAKRFKILTSRWIVPLKRW